LPAQRRSARIARTKPAEQRRADLLEAGRELFLAKGAAATSLDDITSRVGLRRAALPVLPLQAARLLLASSAPGNIPAAIFAYNHSPDYVTEVLGCTLAAVSQAPSQIAAQIITFAMNQVGKPYQWGATGPDVYDCSGLIYAAYPQRRHHLAAHHPRHSGTPSSTGP
jgi:cell wall-associated NlpC family hydrolase